MFFFLLFFYFFKFLDYEKLTDSCLLFYLFSHSTILIIPLSTVAFCFSFTSLLLSKFGGQMTTCAVGITGVQALDQMNLFFFFKKKNCFFSSFFFSY